MKTDEKDVWDRHPKSKVLIVTIAIAGLIGYWIYTNEAVRSFLLACVGAIVSFIVAVVSFVISKWQWFAVSAGCVMILSLIKHDIKEAVKDGMEDTHATLKEILTELKSKNR